MTEDIAKVVRDDGYKRQWAVCRYFQKREGGKNRLDSKRITYACIAVSIIAVIASLFKDDRGQVATSSKTVSIPQPRGESTDSQTLNVPVNNGDQSRSGASEHGRKGGNRVSAMRQFFVLEKVEQSTAGKIPPGSLLKATLASGASDGPVRAILSENLKISGEVILKKGSILLGKGSSTDERLMVGFNRVVFKDGTNVEINAQACDISDKMPGLKGSNIRGKALKLSGAIGLGLVGGTAIGLQQRQSVGDNRRPTMRDALLNGLATTSIEQARGVSSDIQNTRPLIEVPVEQEFFILFDGG